MPLAEDQHPVGDLGPGREHEPFRIGIRSRAPGRNLHGLDTGVGQDCVKRYGELPCPVADQEPEIPGAIAEIHQEIPDLLRGPRPVRVRGHSQNMHIPGADLDHEQAIQALQGHRAVHMEEVGREHGRGLRAQELPPGRVGTPLGRRGNLQRLEDPADRRCADPVAELEQLTLDSLVSPAVVLGGDPLDERGDLSADWRPSRPVAVSPLAGDQAAVPAQDGAGGDQPVRPQPCRQEPGQRGEHRPVGPVQPGPRMGPAQHGDLMPQHQELGVLGGRRPGEQDQPAAEPDQNEIEQAEGHGLIMMPYDWPWSSLQLTGHADFWHPTSRLTCPQPAGPRPAQPQHSDVVGAAATCAQIRPFCPHR